MQIYDDVDIAMMIQAARSVEINTNAAAFIYCIVRPFSPPSYNATMGGERVRLFVKAQVFIIVFQTNALNTRDVD